MEIIQQIKQKENELNTLKEQYNNQIEQEKAEVLKGKSTGINKSLYLLNFNFESSSIKTQQYLEFHKTFKRELTAVLKPYCKEIQISKPNHFDVSGFFRLNDDRVFYFRLEDLRWSKDNILIRNLRED